MQKLSNLKFSRQLLGWLILVLIVILCGLFYWRYTINYPSTDDAYVQANIVNVAAQVTGPVQAVYVQDHQFVKQGALLFTIDPVPFQLAVQAAQAQLELAVQNVGAAYEAVKVAQAAVTQREAELINTQKMAARTFTLVAKGLLPKANGDDARMQLNVAKAALIAAQNTFAQTQQELGKLGEQNAQYRAAQTKLQQAQLDLQHTQITAPADGTITNFNLRSGSMINAGVMQFAFIEQAQWWIDANFKETDLQRIKVGQSAEITTDIYPDHTYHGVVQGISLGSGAAFSLLPPENATGNWVKVTQRFSVRINILNPDPHYPLRVGASSTVTIDTRGSGER